jgi:hypothetical protein
MASSIRTAWHPLLVTLLRRLLPVDGFDVQGEFSLTREPLRLDVVVLRKLRDARPLFPLFPALLDDLTPHTLISFKGPTDVLEADDAAMLQVYAALYLVVAQVDSPRDVTLRLVAPTLTPRFKGRFLELGGQLSYQGQGLSTGSLGPFALRVIETERIYEQEHEHLWFAFSPSLVQRHRPPEFEQDERFLYQFLYQQVAQFRAKGDPLMYKDIDLAKVSIEEALALMMNEMPPEIRLAGLAPEQRLAGLAPEQRLAGLAPEQRLAGLTEDQAVLALPTETLRKLPAAFVQTLTPDTQAAIAARLARK